MVPHTRVQPANRAVRPGRRRVGPWVPLYTIRKSAQRRGALRRGGALHWELPGSSREGAGISGRESSGLSSRETISISGRESSDMEGVLAGAWAQSTQGEEAKATDRLGWRGESLFSPQAGVQPQAAAAT